MSEPKLTVGDPISMDEAVERMILSATAEVRAVQVTAENIHEVADWCGCEVDGNHDNPALYISMAEGAMAWIGDLVVFDGAGFHPCKPEVFAATYEPVAEIAEAGDGS